jgi:hypothetical protein
MLPLEFVMHNHVIKWQDVEYKVSLKMFKGGEIFSLIDFVENYSFKLHDGNIGTTLVQISTFHLGAYYLPSEFSMAPLGFK